MPLVSDQYRDSVSSPPTPFSWRTYRALSVWLITSHCYISPFAGRRLQTAICVYEIPEIRLTSDPLLKGQAGRRCGILLLLLLVCFTLGFTPVPVRSQIQLNGRRPLLQQHCFWKFLSYWFISGKSFKCQTKPTTKDQTKVTMSLKIFWSYEIKLRTMSKTVDIEKELTSDPIMNVLCCGRYHRM